MTVYGSSSPRKMPGKALQRALARPVSRQAPPLAILLPPAPLHPPLLLQRGDAEVAQKLWRVVRACVELGPANPIAQIHDQGAGGNCNVVKEIIYPLGEPRLPACRCWSLCVCVCVSQCQVSSGRSSTRWESPACPPTQTSPYVPPSFALMHPPSPRSRTMRRRRD